jgi:hypothetical protein
MNVGKHDDNLWNVSADDRRLHFYLVGSTGSGKTTLLLNMLAQDFMAGEGVCLIDPHGDAAEAALALIPSHRAKDLIYIDPASLAFPVAWNPLCGVLPDDRSTMCDNIVEAMRSIWHENWGPRMEWQLWYFTYTLMCANHSLLGLGHISTNDDFRRKCIRQVNKRSVVDFWKYWEDKKNDRVRPDWISPILNKVGRLRGSDAIANILGQQESTINLRRALDERRIVIVNLSKGKLGADNAGLLGALIVSGIVQAALSRADMPERDRAPFHLYVD